MPTEPSHRAGRILVLVRHGQTAWNAEGRAQGHADVTLDDIGRAQAEAMAEELAELRPVALASSDLSRARETAAFLEKATGLTAVEDGRLREYDVGERTGMTVREFADRVGVQHARDVHAHVEVPGAETSEAVHERIVPALRELLDRLGAGGIGIAVLHGAALRIGLAGLLGWPLAGAQALEAMANCHWAVLRESAGGRLRLAAYNVGPEWRPVGADG